MFKLIHNKLYLFLNNQLLYCNYQNSRGDPMQYGAYRRWKLAEDSNLDSKGKPKKNKKKSSTGYVAGDYKVDGANGGKAIGSRDVGSKKKNKGGSLNADSFYDAIKKFGSGVKVSYTSAVCVSVFCLCACLAYHRAHSATLMFTELNISNHLPAITCLACQTTPYLTSRKRTFQSFSPFPLNFIFNFNRMVLQEEREPQNHQLTKTLFNLRKHCKYFSSCTLYVICQTLQFLLTLIILRLPSKT